MASEAYAEVLAWLYGLEAARGMDFKLERVALALKNLGDPHKQFKSVHVAGTNGKGSVAAMLHSMFTAGGYRVGLYTSPHLVSFTERIRIGANEIDDEEVVELAAEIRTAATVRGIDLTFFEFVTVLAFLHFAHRRVDLAIVEVGLGGRLDATNVIDPEVAVITSIGLDHEEFLGTTLASVAREKAGIIKTGRALIVGGVTGEAERVIRSTAASRGAPAFWSGRDFWATGAPAFDFRGMGTEISGLCLLLRGMHQRDNAAVAIATALQVRQAFPLPDETLRQGLAEVRWPGRLDVVQSEPLVVLDGAHNADGIAALVRALPEITADRAVHLLFAVMRDKRWQPMVDALGPLTRTATLTTILGSRAAAPEELAPAFARYCPTRMAAAPLVGLEMMLRAAGPDDAIVVAGSLSLVGAVYPYFLSRRGQPSLFRARAAALHP